jgi:hypothetical protein
LSPKVFFARKLLVYIRVIKPTACVALARKAADKIKITISFRSVGIKKINEHVVNSNKLKYNLAGLVASCLGRGVARGPPVGPG